MGEGLTAIKSKSTSNRPMTLCNPEAWAAHTYRKQHTEEKHLPEFTLEEQLKSVV